MRLKKYICNRQGFTLVGLIVATAIIGLVAELMAMGLAAQMPKRRLNGAARKVMLDVMEARIQAIHQNQNILVKFSNDHEYRIGPDTNNNGTLDAGEGKTEDIQDQYESITFAAPLPPVFTFDPRGFSDRPSTITLSNASGSKSITVAITGRAKIN